MKMRHKKMARCAWRTVQLAHFLEVDVSATYGAWLTVAFWHTNFRSIKP